MNRLVLMLSLLTAGAAAAPLVQAQDWSGPWVGATAGAVRAGDGSETLEFDTNLDGSYGDTVNTAGGANAFSPGFCDGFANGRSAAEDCRKDDERGGLGLRGGYDWQRGNLVFGVLGDVSSVEIADSVTAFSVTPAAYVFTREIDYVAAIRGRVGWAANDWMVYATAGAAWTEIDRTFTTTNALNSFTATDGEDEIGYQIGFGAEQRFAERWTIGLEYLHTAFHDEAPVVRAGPSSNTFASNPFLIVNPAGTDMRRSEDSFTLDQVLITLTYRFGGM